MRAPTNKRERIKLEHEWMKEKLKGGAVCGSCGRSENLTIDHVIPDAWRKQLGVNVEQEFDPENLQVLCYFCNQFKGDRVDPKTLARVIPLMRKYINKLEKELSTNPFMGKF